MLLIVSSLENFLGITERKRDSENRHTIALGTLVTDILSKHFTAINRQKNIGPSDKHPSMAKPSPWFPPNPGITKTASNSE